MFLPRKRLLDHCCADWFATRMDPQFIPGLTLSRRYFHEAAEPVIAAALPGLRYGAALIGAGSEVLGFDTPMSTDHNWGPRVLLFLAPDDLAARGEVLWAALEAGVADTFLGWPTRLEHATQHERRDSALRIEVHTLDDWVRAGLGIGADRDPGWRAWLGLPEQALIEITAGAVFRDDLGELAALRSRLAYFPRDVWLHKLACQWTRIGQEQAFVGRTAELGDDLGSRIIAARLARDVMRLAFLVERRYAPYPKWLGAAFARLPSAAVIGPLIAAALRADDRRQREAAIATAALRCAERHVSLGHPGALAPQLSTYSELVRRPGDPPPAHAVAPARDFTVINADALADAIRAEIADPELRALAPVGAVDQFSDSTDLLEWPRLTLAAAKAVSLSGAERAKPPS
jgi:hypothetical protein